jgi:hypothetical protein
MVDAGSEQSTPGNRCSEGARTAVGDRAGQDAGESAGPKLDGTHQRQRRSRGVRVMFYRLHRRDQKDAPRQAVTWELQAGTGRATTCHYRDHQHL